MSLLLLANFWTSFITVLIFEQYYNFMDNEKCILSSIIFNIHCDLYLLYIGKFLIIIGKSNKPFKLKKSNLFLYFLLVKSKEKIPTQQFFRLWLFFDEIIKNDKNLPIYKNSCKKFYTLVFQPLPMYFRTIKKEIWCH